MGRFANFAAVYAKIIIEDNDYGLGVFLVQLRDRDTHKHMPGIKCGDIGPKFGFHDKDNGWCTFDKVRIPRRQMLMKFTKVDTDGTFSIEGDTRILFSTMLKTRVQMISATKWVFWGNLLVAVRYSLVRRQFKNISGVKEET